MATKTAYTYALGRRKSSTARVRLTKGKGDFIINNKTAEDYFDHSAHILEELNQPFKILDKNNQFNVSVIVAGGGLSGQSAAIRLGIAKCLVSLNEDNRTTLKKADMLGRDSREKERKKYGLKSARKQRQFTKR